MKEDDVSRNPDDSEVSDRQQGGGEEERDEVAEVKKLAKKETNRVIVMRLVIIALLVAAFAITAVTFLLLQKEQKRSFEAAVRHRSHSCSVLRFALYSSFLTCVTFNNSPVCPILRHSSKCCHRRKKGRC